MTIFTDAQIDGRICLAVKEKIRRGMDLRLAVDIRREVKGLDGRRAPGRGCRQTGRVTRGRR